MVKIGEIRNWLTTIPESARYRRPLWTAPSVPHLYQSRL